MWALLFLQLIDGRNEIKDQFPNANSPILECVVILIHADIKTFCDLGQLCL